MKKILEIIFSKTVSRPSEQAVKTPVVYRRLAESPDSLPGDRTEMSKRRQTSAPGELDNSWGRI
jgi:hypothetical protein